MASSGNFMTWSSLWSCDSSYPPSPDVFSGGNCRYSSSNSNNGFGATHSFLSGKWYWEVYIVANGNKQLILGLVTPETKNVASQLWNTVGVYGVASGSGVGYKLIENSPGFVEIDGFDDVANGDIVQLAFDRDNYKLWVGRNNTWLESGNPAGDSNPLISGSDFAFQGGAVMPVIGQGSASTFTMVLNAGQDDTFGGEITGAGNADENGHGVFKYAPPTGFLAVCSANLPISADIDPAGDNGADENPTKQFNTVLWTGDGNNNRSVTGVGFKPDLLWGKVRSSADEHFLYDSSRGSNRLLPSTNSAEADYSSYWSQFDSDGWTFGNNASSQNLSSATFVGWCWRANGGTTATNSDGSTDSTVQANTKAGFSIITYAGNGSNRTIGHGLSSAPDFMIFKNRDASSNWVVYARSQGAGNRGQVNTANAWGASSTSFQSTDPTSSVISLGTSSGTNASGNDFVCYAWHNVEGFQKFGSYNGNGNADGAFVYTGFRPRLIFIKNADTSGRRWTILDSARNTFNLVDSVINWNESQAEYDSSGRGVDILSTGFKIKGTDSDNNTSGNTYVYGTWGDIPARYGNTF